MIGLLLPILAACVGEDREQAFGDRVAEEVNARVPLVHDRPLNRYVSRLGHLLARASARPHLPYRFHIINADEVNAFALPGGHVYVNRGLIERTDNVSELAAVLAHEIAHVAARHGAQEMERQLRTGSVVSVLYHLILGREPAILNQNALRLGGALWSAGHSREDEAEADRLAVRYLVKTGVDPRGTVSLLDDLLEEEEGRPNRAARWFSTHPMTGERIRVTRAEIDALSEAPGDARIRDLPSYPDFLRRMRALPPSPPFMMQ